jgi:iron complex outermembrane recepter protein
MLTGAMRLCALAGMILSAALSPGAIAAPSDTIPQSIDIPAGDLVDSLERLAKQSGIELVFDADKLKGVKTAGVSGRMTAMQAVHKLLEGTHLTLVEHPDGAILVTPPLGADPKSGELTSAVRDAGRSVSSSDFGPHAATSNTAPSPDSDQKMKRDSVLKTIVVTGTHIRGETPIGSSLTVHTRAEMEQSGSATLEQFGRDMPENYAGTDAVSTINSNGGVGNFEQGAASNIFGGAGFNLKGLGPGSTLTLLNGHRLAAGGLDGSLVDISQIPLSAIDHIEVLDDGASAIYGSDAVAGVVNIVMRREFDGAETGLRYGRSTQGGAAEYTASQIAGHDWVTGNVLFSYEYDNQEGLDATQRKWIGSQGGAFSLIPENRRHSFYLTASQAVGGSTTLSTDVLYSDRHFESHGLQIAPNSLLDELQSSTGHVTQSAATLSVDRTVFDVWDASITGHYSSVKQLDDSVTPGVGAPTGTTGHEQLVADSDIRSVDALLNGELFDLSESTVKASMGGSFRSEHFKSDESNGSAAGLVSERRDVVSAYGEIIVPVVGEPLPWARRLVVSAAYRYDHYEGFGPTRNPKVGWLWEPTAGLRLKGTAGTSFKAPLLSQLGAPITSYTALFPLGGAQGGKTDALIINGGNSGLHAENATSVTMGMEYEPAALNGLIASTNFFWLRFDNRIQAQNILPQPLLSQPQLLFISGINPGVGYVQSYFGSPGFQGDTAGLGPAGVSFLVDNQFANTASTLERGINASSRYHWSTAHGQFDAWFAGQYLLVDRIRTAVYAQELTVDNSIGEPPKFKARGGINWTSEALIADLTLNYVNAYRNTLFMPSQRIEAWTTADLYLGYSTGSDESHHLDNLQIGLSVQNLSDQKPPYLQIPSSYLSPGRSAIPFDGANASPVGRLISLQFKKRW